MMSVGDGCKYGFLMVADGTAILAYIELLCRSMIPPHTDPSYTYTAKIILVYFLNYGYAGR